MFRNYYIYDFGKGYQTLGQEDRLCFTKIKALIIASINTS
ncbi:hypothetical protein ACT5AM_003006 [Cronobacter malonaticus]